MIVWRFGGIYGYRASDGARMVHSPQLGWIPAGVSRAWVAAVKARLSGGAL